MTGAGLPSFPFEAAIEKRARVAGIELTPESVHALADHARLTLSRNPLLHLTAITSPAEFVERHLGESFEGARLLPAPIGGVLLDLGSGNGYPGIPLAHARPGLDPVLAESGRRKAAFLREALAASRLPRGRVLERSVQRAADLQELRPLAVIATRAMGGWERIVPKLVHALAPDGRILLWAGAELAEVLGRASWAKLEVLEQRMLPGRERSSVVSLRLR